MRINKGSLFLLKLTYIPATLFLFNAQVFAQTYPFTKTSPDIDIHFGVAYPDPYRWLEDLDNPETAQWYKEQALYTNDVMSKISGRDDLIREWEALDKLTPDQVRGREYRGGRLFFRKIAAGTNVSKIYYREGKFGKDVFLFDPETYTTGKTLSVSGFLPSHDGKFLGIAFTENGAEIGILRILDVATKKFLPEELGPTWGGITEWTFDNTGFLYSKLSSADVTSGEALKNSKTMYHRLKTDPSEDIDFFSRARNPELGIREEEWPTATLNQNHKNYIVSYVNTVQSEQKLYIAPASSFFNPKIEWELLVGTEDSVIQVEFKDQIMYAITTKGGTSNYKLIKIDLRKPDVANATVLIPEKEKLIQSMAISKDYLLLVYSDGINGYLYKMNLSDEKLINVKTPISGTIGVYNLDKSTNEFIINIGSFIQPFTEFELDLQTNEWKKSRYNEVPVYPEKYNKLKVEDVEVKGHDGTMIPLTIVYDRDLVKDGNNPCFMESYGAYGSSMVPYFNYMQASLATKGIVLAYPHVRGGGEKGEKWYRAGFKKTKPNTWKDFNSCAEWLINSGYTNAKKLAGTGTSAGGILITRAITERPDLYAAAVTNVGCNNAMRMENTPNGPGNIPEFGTVKDSTECRALYEMDGTAHVQYGVEYPAVMSVGGWNDPRVIVWQPGKFAAAMQNCSKSQKPVLLKVNYDNGHFTEDKKVTWANFADQYAFMMWQCGHKDFQKKENRP
ncbi:MAG TPA: prolyl oligopeptidase family serine peptidase [Saprospiraceae bacterium]|nr:prolyl oligopeptidase family serine peptidase [Saprospiraceae bacterium]